MSISLKELAKQAGVSEATVSLAMNNRPGVNAATRQRILELAKTIGYIPSVTAQTLAKQKSGLIGVIVPNLSNNNYSSLVQLAEDRLLSCGYKMILATSKSNPEYEKDMIQRFVSFRTEGVIIYPSIKDNPDPSYLEILNQYHIPFIFLGGRYRNVDASCVMPDFYQTAYNSAEYLYQRGGRHFCLISGCRSIVSNTLRRQGISDLLAEHGLTFEDSRHIALEHTNYDAAYDCFNTLLDSGMVVDSVFAVNTYVGLAVYNAVIEHGLRVPEDLSIISGDMTMPPKACCIPLTSIRQNNSKMVEHTLNELFRKIKGKIENAQECIASEFIPGASTKP